MAAAGTPAHPRTVAIVGIDVAVGAALARRWLDSGGRVFGLAWPEGTCAALPPVPGATALHLGRDLDRDLEAFFDGVSAARIVLDAVVTVSALAGAGPEHVAEAAEAEWSQALERRLGRICVATRHATRALLAQAGGRVVHVAVDGQLGKSGDAAAIPALLAFAESVAREYGPKGVACEVLLGAGTLPVVEAALRLLAA